MGVYQLSRDEEYFSVFYLLAKDKDIQA